MMMGMIFINLLNHLSLILWIILGALSAPLFFYDLTEKQVHISLLLSFCLLLVILTLCENGSSVMLKIMVVGGFIALSWPWCLRMGHGDRILLGGIAVYFPIAQWPLYMIFCGSIGLIFGVFWRYQYREKHYPFIPSILLSFWLQLCLEGRV